MTNADLSDPERASDILKIWATLGRRVEEQRPAPSWQAVQRLIEPSRDLLKLLRKEFEALVSQSDRHLHPLSDPFHLDFSGHRSFTGTREERYSDWLAWILDHVSNPEWVFELLQGDDASHLVQRCKRERPTIEREPGLGFEDGHEGQTGRADLVIRYAEALVLLHIEVKVREVTKAEWNGGDLEKNKRYAESLSRKFGEYEQRHVLLVTEADEKSYRVELAAGSDVEFFVLKWKDLSLRLRQLVNTAGLKEEQPLLAALILGFVGTVEQTLLGFPSLQSFFSSSTVIDYLKEHLREGWTMSDKQEQDAARDRLVKEGLVSYCDAEEALKAFQHEIQRRIRQVVEARLPDLSDATGIQVEKRQLYSYVNEVWIAIQMGMALPPPIGKPGSGFMWYFGIFFEKKDAKRETLVTVTVDTRSASFRDFIVKKWDTKVEAYRNEVYVSVPLDWESFAQSLNGLIDQWVMFWRTIGGVRNLPHSQ